VISSPRWLWVEHPTAALRSRARPEPAVGLFLNMMQRQGGLSLAASRIPVFGNAHDPRRKTLLNLRPTSRWRHPSRRGPESIIEPDPPGPTPCIQSPIETCRSSASSGRWQEHQPTLGEQDATKVPMMLKKAVPGPFTAKGRGPAGNFESTNKRNGGRLKGASIANSERHGQVRSAALTRSAWN